MDYFLLMTRIVFFMWDRRVKNFRRVCGGIGKAVILENALSKQKS